MVESGEGAGQSGAVPDDASVGVGSADTLGEDDAAGDGATSGTSETLPEYPDWRTCFGTTRTS